MKLCANASDEIVVATASDENYAIGMSVTVKSAIHCLAPDDRLRVFVLDGGITPSTRCKLLASWEDPRVRVEWITPDMQVLRQFSISAHINHCTYLRILMPHVLPASLDKVIYLDADLLVRRNLAELWQEDFRGAAALAAFDLACPYVDIAAVNDRSASFEKHLATRYPIPNFVDLGIPADAEYFNAGVLVADLSQWRKQGIADQAFECLRIHSDHVTFWDQYALNVVLHGRWRRVDSRWNQHTFIYRYPNWEQSPYSRETFHTLQNDPWIVHFTAPEKPWHYGFTHPHTLGFFECLDATAWKGYRPSKPPESWRQWWRSKKNDLRAMRRGIKRRIREAFSGIVKKAS